MNSVMIGQRIRRARKAMNMTQEELGRLICADGKYISRLENGKSLPSLKRLVQLSRVLERSCDYFLQGYDVTEVESEASQDMDQENVLRNNRDLMHMAYEFLNDVERMITACSVQGQ